MIKFEQIILPFPPAGVQPDVGQPEVEPKQYSEPAAGLLQLEYFQCSKPNPQVNAAAAGAGPGVGRSWRRLKTVTVNFKFKLKGRRRRPCQ